MPTTDHTPAPAPKKWYHIQWYSDTDTKEERKLIVKLDLLIVPYAVLSYWVKYLDQSNLSEFDAQKGYERLRQNMLTPQYRQCICRRVERRARIQGQ